MAGSFVPPDVFANKTPPMMGVENLTGGDYMVVDFDGGGKAINSGLSEFMGSSRDEDSDDDLYLSLPESETESVSGSPKPVHKNMDQDLNVLQNANVFAGANSSAPIQSNITSKVRGKTSTDSPTRKEKANLPVPTPPILDLSKSVKGMYRILDLISEQGSGGLVDKIIIAQDSLREFINILSPGAYASLTKVDFRALDKLTVKPLGVYGSKQGLVRLLLSIGAIDNATAQKLLTAKENFSGTSSPTLRSGLYIVRSSNMNYGEQLYVLYWPQETTWDDSAVSSVRRNRVTFIRHRFYLIRTRGNFSVG